MECEILFLGFGPITQAFAKRLIANGHKVAVVTEQSIEGKANSEFLSDSFTIMNWQTAIARQIISESTYIGWRHSPQSLPLGEDLIDWVRSAKMETRRIHHLSSAAVYSGAKEIFSESDDDLQIAKVDMNAKQNLEKLVREIGREKQTGFVNYRIANVYGAGLKQGFINESIHNLVNDRPIKIFKQVDLVRDYLSVNDLMKALIELRRYEFPYEILNISTGLGVAVSEIIELLKVSNTKELKFIEIEMPKETLVRSILSCEKLKELILWSPIRVEESLKGPVLGLL